MKLSDDQKNFVKWVGVLAPIYIVFYQMVHLMRTRSLAWDDLLIHLLMTLALLVLGLLFFPLWDYFSGKKKQ